MSTQPQPDPGPHLRHNSHQQLPVRPASNSDALASSSTMQDHRHPRRTAPEDSQSLRQQRQEPMDTAVPSQLPGAEQRENRIGAVGVDLGGKFEQESSSREGRPQPIHHGGSGFASGGTDMEVPMNPPIEEREGWKMAFRSSEENAPSGVGDGAEGTLGEIDRESIADSGAHKSASEDWFNAFNRNVGGNNYATLDDDPPYYLPNAYKKSNLGSISRGYSRLQKFYPNRSSRTGMKRLHPAGSIGVLDSTEESNSDSFRSVIDDLTVKNQKLKKRLKKLEGLHGGGLAEEKLFEVRMHGLSLHKKQELERLLQSFASTLDTNNVSSTSSKKSPEILMAPSLPSINPSSSSLNIADSAYVSNSRSGTTSVAQSSHLKTKTHVARSSSASENVSGGSGMSSLTAITSERNKMKEVVRKLEQLFTGFKLKNSGSTPESTNSDRSGSNAGGVIPEEGAREASIMNPLEDKQAAELGDSIVVPRSDQHSIVAIEITDQRPTRPKDLDPKRLAKTEDNIKYLSNLTHSSAVGTKAEGLGDGWFFLNLIINMAQIHTINVTVPFIKKAILTTSEKLELSGDGKMVRWRGGLEGTRLSSESSSGSGVDSASITSDGSPEDSWDGVRKRSPNDSDGNVMSIDPPSKSGSRGRASSSSRRFPSFTSPASTGDKFHYKPMFAQSGSFDDDASSIADTSIGSFPRGSSDEGGVASVGKKTLPLDGPIIYYEGGKFCTDLTTQVVVEGKYLAGFPYERFTNNPIGEKQPRVPLSPNTKRESPLFSKDTPPSIPSDNDSMNLDEDVGLQFSPRFSSSVPQTPPPPIELEVSGIGGVLPEDNFAINVRKRHFLLPQDANGALPCSRKKLSKSRILRKISHRIPKSSIDAFQQNEDVSDSTEGSSDDGSGTSESETSELDSGDERSAESGADASEGSDSESSDTSSRIVKTRRRFNHHKLINPELVSAHILRLEPSALPPANYVYFAASDETSSVDTDSGAEPNSSSSEGFILSILNQNKRNTDIYGNSGDDDDLGNEILAANGMRIYRPVTTESGDAGSSAATAGDASGYSTPAMATLGQANMIPSTMNSMDMGGNAWGNSPDSDQNGDQFSPSTGDDEDSCGMLKDRPTLKRGRGSGTSSSESAIGLVRKTARKSEKAIMLDDPYC